MRLAYLVELVVVLAVGLAAARWELGDRVARDAGAATGLASLNWIGMAGVGFVTGAALVGVIGLGVEVARRRTPRPWGLGRWTWSVVGVWLVARPAFSIACHGAAYLSTGAGTWSQFLGLVPDNVRAVLQLTSLPPLACLVLALGVTRRIAAPGPVATDAREWSGRGFAALVVAVSLWSDALVMISIFG